MKKWIWMVCGIVALLWLWPNIVHEPLHKVALLAQGSDGDIVFDWRFPPHPFVVRQAVSGLAGGLFFLLLPSVVSVLLLVWISLASPKGWKAALGVYLVFDLIINLRGFNQPSSDFHWVIAVPNGVVVLYGAIVLLFLTGSFICIKHMDLHKLQEEA